MWRMSSVIRVSPAVAVTTPGHSVALPTVVTPTWRLPISATSSAKRAAARKLSRRISIGMVPACDAWPVKIRRSRSMPLVPVTVQMPRPIDSSTGPCSMCTST